MSLEGLVGGKTRPSCAAAATLFLRLGIVVDAYDEKQLMLFPEMDASAEVPEITTACWDILGAKPDDMMCASARMVVKHKGEAAPSVMACTLLAYDERFIWEQPSRTPKHQVPLNHPHCAKFCVLGGGACSACGNAGVTGVRRPANFAVLGSERRPESVQRPSKHVEYCQMLDAAGPATALRVRSGLFPVP